MYSSRIEEVIIPWAKTKGGRPTALILDNVSFHMSAEVATLCDMNGIRLIGLPRNSTYITQPLDVAFFGPFKGHLRTVLGRLVQNI